VATNWVPLLQTGIGAVAAIGGGAVGAWLQGKSAERIEKRRLRREEDVDRQQRRERATVLLAEISDLLRDTMLHRIFAEHVPSDSEVLKEQLFTERQELDARQKAAREQLLLLAIREPSPEVRRIARELEPAMSRTVRAVFLRRGSELAGDDGDSTLDEIAAECEEEHSKAIALLNDLIEAL
jgi:hypothetical protein